MTERQLRASGAFHSGRSTISEDSEEIMQQSVDNFYAVKDVREVFRRFDDHYINGSWGGPDGTRRLLMFCEDTIAEIKAAIKYE